MIKIDIHSNPFPNFDVQGNLNFKKGEIAVLNGESGSGKSTFLNMIAGLIASKGLIQIDDECWLDTDQEKINLKPGKRNIGYVFQESTLFPNMTVKQNLEYAINGKASKEILDRYLQEVNLKEYHNRKPDQLSGGQKQRINFIRALIRKPKLLILDEPANAQDQANRKKLQDLLLREKQNGLSIIMVSHDESEIEALADVVFKMENGKIKDNYRPERRKTKEFEIQGRVVETNDDFALIETRHGRLKVPNDSNYKVGSEINLKQKELNLITEK